MIAVGAKNMRGVRSRILRMKNSRSDRHRDSQQKRSGQNSGFHEKNSSYQKGCTREDPRPVKNLSLLLPPPRYAELRAGKKNQP
jgi:hypothetical protein